MRVRFGRFGETGMWVLVALLEGPRNVARLLDDVRSLDGHVGPGTLYGAIARLEARGLIERLKSDDRRNPYQLTDQGGQALRARLASLETVARTAPKKIGRNEPCVCGSSLKFKDCCAARDSLAQFVPSISR